MNYDSAPTNVRSLEQRLRSLEGDDGLALRRRTAMALVVVSQMLPEGAVKGGSSMDELLTRFTRDPDAARIQPVPVTRADHQVAQKLHAVSSVGSERARDLVDLQLLDRGEDLDFGELAATCIQLFSYRCQQAWPPVIASDDQRDTLYVEAAEGLDVIPTVKEAVAWTNEFVQRIAAATI